MILLTLPWEHIICPQRTEINDHKCDLTHSTTGDSTHSRNSNKLKIIYWINGYKKT